MAGLIVALLLALAALQEPPAPPGHLERVQELLAADRPHDAWWHSTLFQSATRLEHAPVELVLPARAAESDGLAFLQSRAGWVIERLDRLPKRIPFTTLMSSKRWPRQLLMIFSASVSMVLMSERARFSRWLGFTVSPIICRSSFPASPSGESADWKRRKR